MPEEKKDAAPAAKPNIAPMAQYASDFEKVFIQMVGATKNGHTGDIASRSQPYEP